MLPSEIESRVAGLAPAARSRLADLVSAEESHDSSVANRDRLIAFYLPAGANTAVEGEELRSYLKQRLPNYMVPADFVELDAVPRTANGKVDRKALQHIRFDLQSATSSFVAPTGPVEGILAKAFENVLGVSRIGATDSFFDLGGHSMLALMLVAQIEKDFGKKMPIATLFRAPTIRDLAGVLRDQGWTGGLKSVLPMRTTGTRPPLFCVHGLAGNVMFYKDLVRLLGDDQPVYGVQAIGVDDVDEPIDRLEVMVEGYVDEIMSVQPHGPYALAGRCFGGTVAYEIAQQLTRRGEEVCFLGILEGTPPLLAQTAATDPTFGTSRKPEKTLQYYINRTFYFIEEGKVLDAFKTQFRRTLKLLRSDQAKVLRKVWDANRRAEVAYRTTSFPGRISLFGCRERHDYKVKTGNLARWHKLAERGLDYELVEGTHMSMLEYPHVSDLAARIRERMDQAFAGSTVN